MSNVFTPLDFKLWRISHGFTRKSLAAKIGLGKSTIDKYEQGYRVDIHNKIPREVIIPLVVRYALAAVHAGLEPVCANPALSRMPYDGGMGGDDN